MPESPVIWRPDPERVATSHLNRFVTARRAEGVRLPPVTDPAAFAALHRWSVERPDLFWAAVWREGGVVADTLDHGGEWDEVVIGADRMAPPDDTLGPRWFTGARLNFAENLLRYDGTGHAIVAWDERGRWQQLTWAVLRREVAQVAAGMRALGIAPGDRVAGWMPNIPETVVAMLATAAIGAVWTSCSPDFGVDGILDRFGQTTPVVLFSCDAYQYAGKLHQCADRHATLLERLPSLRHSVVVPYRGDGTAPADPRVLRWEALHDRAASPEIDFARLPFDHPLYVMYSSGTTGLPKCMVHSAGGTLLQHLKEHRLHVDLRENEHLFYFTTCGWMMWNWQVTALATGATLVLYDGAPLPAAEPGLLWRMAAQERLEVFGTSAKYLALAEKQPLHPARDHDLGPLRTVLSTGSPLAPESFDWIGRAVGPRVQVASISGGTDIVSCFVLGNPITPVHRGEIQGPGLGMAVDVFDDAGRTAPIGEPGELVCTRPFPSMPTRFWNDPDGARYRGAYFERFPGVWCHGDWAARTASGGFVISGRSDATLNPGGVRIGTAEIYRQVEAIAEVVEALAIAQRVGGEAGGDERVVLFVRLRDGVTLTDSLSDAIRRQVRAGTSPHHVPRVIVQVADIPRTRSGKLSELAVRAVVEGRPVATSARWPTPRRWSTIGIAPNWPESGNPPPPLGLLVFKRGPLLEGRDETTRRRSTTRPG